MFVDEARWVGFAVVVYVWIAGVALIVLVLVLLGWVVVVGAIVVVVVSCVTVVVVVGLAGDYLLDVGEDGYDMFC